MDVMYVSDKSNNSVTSVSKQGHVKAIYKDNGLSYPTGICTNKSGVVYVVGHDSHTVHQMDTDSGEFKLLLDHKNGLGSPWSLCYCDVEDRMYVGNFHDPFQLK